ncbi:MAG: alpha/beta hydrolase [Sedimentisphaerales bacterium]|nr:alpha/beta hydrolase [Sedimentisphaerales bacterium]
MTQSQAMGKITLNLHKVYRPTLAGLGEKVHLANLDVGLDTHVTDVVNTILFEDLHDIVLVGHSYGGMVVTGVAEKIPDRISHLIYLDAFVPEDGESAMTNRGNDDWITKSATNGYIIPPWVSPDQPYPKDVPHPMKTLTDKIVLKNPDRLKIKTDYILTVDPDKEPQQDDFYDSCQRAKSMDWPVHILPADHNPQWSAPEELAILLNKIPNR